MVNEYSDYLKFIDDALELSKKIPKYFSKFSNKIYCNHQKLAIYVLMQKFKTTTRGIVSILRASSDIRLHLGLHRVPVHTTIVRFVNKIRKQINKLLSINQAVNAAVDATGFELETKSYYYRTLQNSDRKQKTKHFMKLSIAVDTDKQTILNCKLRRKFRHDNIDFKGLIRNLNVDYVLADKGYDSRENRLFVMNKLKAKPEIPYRRNSGVTKLRGRFRQIKLNEKRYHQRSKVETIFSSVKRKYGSVLRCKSYTTQKVELISKLITYNVDRKQHYFLLILRGLHQSL